MSIRIAALYLLIAATLVYAWRDWFTALCVAIVLSAVAEHTDMPRSIMGIPGCTPWNVLLAGILLPWLFRRRQEGLRFDMPRPMLLACLGYALVILVAGIRGAADADAIDPLNAGRIACRPLDFAIGHVLDPFKLMLPAILVYDGARSRRRLLGAVIAVSLVGAVYAFLVARRIDPTYLFHGSEHLRARLKLQTDIGLHSNDLATIIGASCWGALASAGVFRKGWPRTLWLAVPAACFYGMLLCFSRAGYIAFCAVGLVVAVLRWRFLFIVLGAAVVLTPLLVPNVGQRMMMGFGATDVSGDRTTDLDAVTSGRATDLWPLAVETIGSSPLIGYGRRAILRTPMYEKLKAQFGGCPSHPHNAYLEMLMDGGIVSLVPVMVFFLGIGVISAVLFRLRGVPLLHGAGGLSLAHVCVLLVTAMSAQSLFPKRSMLPMMCAWAIGARAWVEYRKARTAWACRCWRGPGRG